MTDDKGGVAHFHIGDAAQLQMWRTKLAERLDQAKAGGLVIGERVACDHITAIGGEPNARRFSDEIADGEHQAIFADHHAITAALGAEQIGSEGVRRYLGAHQHHGVVGACQVKLRFLGLRLQRLREGPLLGF